MGIGTYEQFYERLSKMKPNVYIDGKKHDRTEDYMRGGLHVMKETFDCAHDPKYEDVCTATSHHTGEKINRFCHLHRSQATCPRNSS